MKLFDSFRAWLNRDTLAAIKEAENRALIRHLNLVEAVIKQAAACESFERAITDRLDVIEGRLDELKPKEQAEATAVAGHRPWTQRRDQRWTSHFSVTQLAEKLGKAATNGSK